MWAIAREHTSVKLLNNPICYKLRDGAISRVLQAISDGPTDGWTGGQTKRLTYSSYI